MIKKFIKKLKTDKALQGATATAICLIIGCICIILFSSPKQEENIANKIEFDMSVDYSQQIEACLEERTDESFEKAKELEETRNKKLMFLKKNDSITNIFTDYTSWNKVIESGNFDSYYRRKNIKYVNIASSLNLRSHYSTDSKIIGNITNNESVVYLGSIVLEDSTWYKISYNDVIGYASSNFLKTPEEAAKITETKIQPTTIIRNRTTNIVSRDSSSRENISDDVYWLAVAITEEGGGEWYPEWVRNYIGCVVLNRVDSKYYPNTIYNVLYQRGQYAWTTKKHHKEPYPWCLETAKDLLINGNRMLPKDIVYQAEFTQGSYVYEKYHDDVLGTTTYFCGR